MKKNSLSIFIISTAAILNVGCSVFGIRSEEQLAYEVVYKKDSNEIRKYPKQLVARTTVTGSYKEAQNKGFKILAGFIFGDNRASKKIAMTAPVIQEEKKASSVKIAMTAPVIFSAHENKEPDDKESWTMTFSMPSKFTIKTLPQPNNPNIKIEETEPSLRAARIYTGLWSKSRNNKESAKLTEWLSKLKKYKIASAPMFAGYDPPWTLPFLRRNEALIEIQPLDQP